jgi:hypothetical protein
MNPTPFPRIYLAGTGGHFGAPESFTLQYWTGNAWRDAADQQRAPAKPSLDQVNRVTLPSPLTTSKIRALFVKCKGRYDYVALTELESRVPPAAFASNPGSQASH